MGLKATKAKIAYSVDGTAPPEFHAPEHLPPGSDPIMLPADITAEQFVKWDGTKLIGAAAGAANQFQYYTFFDSIDGFIQQCPGSIAFYEGEPELTADPPDLVSLTKNLYYTPETLSWDKNKVIRFAAGLATPGDNTFKANVYVGSDDLAELGIGIHFIRNKIQGWCNDGAGRTYLDLITGLADNWTEVHTFEIRSYPPAYVDFYVDGVYKGKIETHIPAGYDYAWFVFNAYAKCGDAPGLVLDLFTFRHVQDL